jgi:tRNA (cmo5U34)-methyltransferase
MNEFDQKAKEWDKNLMHLERTKAVAGQMQKMIRFKAGMKALEFGAGTGLLSFYLKEMFSEITLIDSSGEMLKMAEQKMDNNDGPKIKTLLLNLETEDFNGDPFDIIYSQMVLHHIRDINAMLKKFYRLLVPGGIVAIADLYPEDGSFHDGDPNVHRGFDPEKLTAVLMQEGFNNVKVANCFIIRKDLPENKVKEYPVFLMTALR